MQDKVIGRNILAGFMLGIWASCPALADEEADHPADRDLLEYPMPAQDTARLKARVVCSCLFVQKLSFHQCLQGKDEIYQYPYIERQKIPQTENEALRVSVSTADAVVAFTDGQGTVARSRYIPDGGGCVTQETDGGIAIDVSELSVHSKPMASQSAPLPRAELASDVDEAGLADTLRVGFSSDGPLRGHARAVMVVHRGQVVAEQYAPGFGPDNRYYMGSVAKIFNNLLAGVLVQDEKLAVSEPIDHPAWSEPDDPRRKITVEHMLHMVSGLSWEEEFFNPVGSGYKVFFAGPELHDVAAYVARQALEAVPGEHYEYTTGGSVLLGRALQERIDANREPSRSQTIDYLRRQLFQPIGAYGIVTEFDEAETILTGESIYARPEDLARIGQLYLNDGQWSGEQILARGWVDYSTDLALSISEEEPYGAHLMLQYVVPGCFGHTGVGGSKLIACPDRELVIVWLSSDFDLLGRGSYSRLAQAYEYLKEKQAQMIRAFPTVDE